MNKHIMRAMGLGEDVKKVEAGLCPICGEDVCMDDFKKEIDRKEFYINGMCQKCQDGIFDFVR